MVLPLIIFAAVLVTLIGLAIWALGGSSKPGKGAKAAKTGISEASGMAFVILVVGMLMISSAMHGH